MKRFCAVLLLLFAGCDNDRFARLEKQNADLERQIGTLQKSTQLELQAKCAKDAKGWFNENWAHGADRGTILLTYTNHYSVAKNKCFITVEYHFNSIGGGGFRWVNSVSVYDVYENQKYGEINEKHDLHAT